MKTDNTLKQEISKYDLVIALRSEEIIDNMLEKLILLNPTNKEIYGDAINHDFSKLSSEEYKRLVEFGYDKSAFYEIVVNKYELIIPREVFMRNV